MAVESWFTWTVQDEKYSDDEFEPAVVLDSRSLRGVPTKRASADRSTSLDDVLASLLAAAAASSTRSSFRAIWAA